MRQRDYTGRASSLRWSTDDAEVGMGAVDISDAAPIEHVALACLLFATPGAEFQPSGKLRNPPDRDNGFRRNMRRYGPHQIGDAVREIARMDASGDWFAIYAVLNPLAPGHQGSPNSTQVLRRRWVLV